MESPLRKALRRNDYNRHKVLRLIKRRNKAKREQEQLAAEKELRKKLHMPKYGDGKLYGVDGNLPIKFDEEGNLINLVTGDTGVMTLPEVTVRPSTPITNNSNEYFNWLMRESSRGGRNFSLQDINSYGRTMQRIANSNEVHNFIGYDGTVYRHGGGGLNIVSPEFDFLSLGGPLAVKLMLLTGANRASKNIGNYIKGWNLANNIYDNTFFKMHPDSWTRGIGMTDVGLRDLVLTGVVRGNPAGTETTAKIFGKLYRKDRDKFRSIMDDTGRDGIALRWFSRTLSEDDFNAIKESAKKFKSDSNFPIMNIDDSGGVRLLQRDIDPLSNYSTYEDYTKAILKLIAETEMMPSRISSGEVAVNRDLRKPVNGFDDDVSFLRGTPIEERFGPNSDYLADGQPLSYWYPDGRNAATNGHDYAGSKYFVRVNNASLHMPFMHDMHLHPSFLEAPKLSDPDLEIFRRGPFGLTFKMDKTKLIDKYGATTRSNKKSVR